MELDTRALPSSPKRPRAAARKTTLDEADTDLLQTTRMFEGARCLPALPAEPRARLDASLKSQCRKKPGEKNDSVLSV
jgi:hypothetical protein